ncbi:glycosyltransferase family 2 protein [uncultured Treponema sp.]|uniref:glycosyltransferase family 2 protein n=1 Tax=uncultured Treponema sp. TaxID=162155 RepID=UPI0025E3FCEC|nr:glycosyltransferase family 2 protein [uncultured Treponema sp.]
MLSVIIPVYNVEKYLSRCVDSVLNQTYKDFELILVDDGSLDNSPVICDGYKKKDSRVKVMHKENGGLSSARNAGLEICKGDYIFFIDSDDWLTDEKVLEEFISKAETENADFVYSFMNTATDKIQKEIRMSQRFKDNDKLFFLSNPYLFSACNKLYKNTLLQFLQFVPGRVNEDVDVIPLVFCSANKVSRLDKHTYNYYQNQESITRQSFSEKRFDMFKSVAHVYKNFIGTKKEKTVFYENLFGFQIFSVYISILKNTSGNKRKTYLVDFCKLLKENNFGCFWKYSFLCFLHNESFSKCYKKIIAWIYLKLFYILHQKEFKI